MFLTATQLARASPEEMSSGLPKKRASTLYPAPARCLAATRPSPPFPPGPQTTATSLSVPNLSMTASATALPAFSISWSLETPRYSEFISTAFISLEVTASPRIMLSLTLPKDHRFFKRLASTGNILVHLVYNQIDGNWRFYTDSSICTIIDESA